MAIQHATSAMSVTSSLSSREVRCSIRTPSRVPLGLHLGVDCNGTSYCETAGTNSRRTANHHFRLQALPDVRPGALVTHAGDHPGLNARATHSMGKTFGNCRWHDCVIRAAEVNLRNAGD